MEQANENVFPNTPPPLDEGSSEVGSYLRAALGYWWLILILVAMGGLAGVVLSERLQKRYRAICRYEVFDNPLLTLGGGASVPSPERFAKPGDAIQRHMVLLEGKQFQERTWLTLRNRFSNVGKPPVAKADPVIGAETSMMDIAVDSADPECALAFLNAVLVSYRKLRDDELVMINNDTLATLLAQQRELSAKGNKLREDIYRFELEHNLDFEAKKSQSEAEHLNGILARERAAHTERAILESQFPFLSSANAATLQDILEMTLTAQGGAGGQAPALGSLPEWRDNEAAVARLEAEYLDKSRVYKPEHPKMRELQDKIEAAKRELRIAAQLTIKRLEARRDALRSQETALRDEGKKVKLNLDLTITEKAKYEQLQAEANDTTKLLDQINQRVIVSSSMPKSRDFSRMVEEPHKLPEAVWPNKPRFVAAGMALGSLLGMGAALLLFWRRSRLFGLDFVEGINRSESPDAVGTLVHIPKVRAKELRKEVLGLNSLPKSDPLCEAYRTLRTKIEERMGSGGKVVVFTSPEKGDGKTFNTLNAALVFAWNYSKVLLVDGDFRKASMTRQLHASREKGFGDWLLSGETEARWQDSLIRNVAPNLDFLPAGSASSEVAELINKGRFQQALAQMREAYDIVIIDTAPVNVVVDTILIARQADAVVLVTQPGKSTVPGVRFAVSRLANSNVIGYLVNKVTRSSSKYYGGYGYGRYGYYGSRYYGYGYGYGGKYGYGSEYK